MNRNAAILVICLVLLAGAIGCGSEVQSREYELAVRNYLDRIVEAYRIGDSTVMEGLVGDAEAKRILGLVGVRLDRGVTLDSELLSLEIRGISELSEGSVEVETVERWRYVERWIGSGLPVENGSEDRYEMKYLLRSKGDRWLVEETSFSSPPDVGRELDAWSQGDTFSHGIAKEEE